MSEVRRSLVAYLAASAACALILVFTFELWRADLRVPLAYGRDSICTQLWAKGIVENGWYLSNPSLGAPFGMEMHDFPLADGLFFLGEKALGRATGDYALVINLYYFATYFLTTLVAMFVLRRFDVPRGPSIVCGLLYAFLPYHFFRGEQHLFLGSYFLVPLAALICLRLYRDGELLFREDETSGRAKLRLGRGAVASLVVCLLIGSGGLYYAAFACYLLLVAGSCAAVARRRLHPLGSAVLLVATIAAVSAANIAPTVIYAAEHGPNPDALRRDAGEVDALGLRMAQMLLPVPGHRIGALARLRAGYDLTQTTTLNENGGATLGLVASLGFLGLVGVALLRGRRPEPAPLVRGLAALNLASLLLATCGGLGAIFGLVVTPLIRCYSRMSVFVSFFALAAVALGLARLVRSARPGAQRLALNFGMGAVLVLGILDQAPPLFVPEYREVAAEFADDAEFVGRIESSLPPGSMIFQLPLIDFPEGNVPGTMGPYDHARAYLHSKSLRWSFGAMKGRYGDAWQKYAADLPASEMLRTLALAGFSGAYVDRAGYADRGAEVEGKLAKASGTAPIASRGGRLAFFELTPYVASLRRDLGPDRWAAESESALRPMIVTWHGGFYGREEGPGEITWHWSDGSGEVRVANPSGRPRRVEISMGLATMAQEPARVWIAGLEGEREYPADSGVKAAMTIPPGGAVLRFRSDSRKVTQAGDPRALSFRVERLRIEESTGPAPVAAGIGPDRR